MKAGWAVKPLGQVCSKIGSGATPKGGEEAYKREGISLIRSLNVHDLEFRVRNLAKIDAMQASDLANVEVRPGDVLLNITGASVARCCLVPTEILPARVNQHVSILRPKADFLEPAFLAYLLVSHEYKARLIGIGDEGGSTRQALTKAQLLGFGIPIPPLDEQKRIVAVLDEAFEGLSRARANAEANLADAHDLFAASLRSEVDRSPDKWREVALSELGKTVTGSTPSTSDAGNLGSYIPFIKPGDFLPDGRLVYDNEGLSEKGAAASRTLPVGSALMVCIGATIGKAGYSDREIATNQQINALVPAEGVSGEFVYLQMISPDFQAAVIRNAGQATLPIINKSKWSALKVRMPRDLAWQDEITSRMRALRDTISDLEARYRAVSLDLDTLRQSLLQKAFAGELT